MADYYPLLSRAIAGLADRPDSDRHAIYGRARDALERQLRGFEPALEEEAIRLELEALEATNDSDKRWRIQYLSTLAMALDDASQTPQVRRPLASPSLTM